ncbi:protein of unknown function [Candidatus Methylopumilus turicensis]|uniref:Uncharacterized protein n=1 Tax=Candidatus Methylopumilus turicensis TaxID=1581680 RepID=A0A0B7IW54_9PROT|nr:protein of unknown function [Candidatus Methylopumilus turicensis]
MTVAVDELHESFSFVQPVTSNKPSNNDSKQQLLFISSCD